MCLAILPIVYVTYNIESLKPLKDKIKAIYYATTITLFTICYFKLIGALKTYHDKDLSNI